MKTVLTIIAISALIIPGTSEARGKRYYSGQTSPPLVNGYTKSNGTYVAPYNRTAPNRTQYDNWSAKGNVNPYTGKRGHKTPSH